MNARASEVYMKLTSLTLTTENQLKVIMSNIVNGIFILVFCKEYRFLKTMA